MGYTITLVDYDRYQKHELQVGILRPTTLAGGGTAANGAGIAIESADDMPTDYFEFFKERRGHIYYPATKSQTTSRLRVLTSDETIERVSYKVIDDVFTLREAEKLSYILDNIVYLEFSTDTVKHYIPCISRDGYQILGTKGCEYSTLDTKNISQPRPNFCYGVGIWYNIDLNAIVFASAYNRVNSGLWDYPGPIAMCDYNVMKESGPYPDIFPITNTKVLSADGANPAKYQIGQLPLTGYGSIQTTLAYYCAQIAYPDLLNNSTYNSRINTSTGLIYVMRHWLDDAEKPIDKVENPIPPSDDVPPSGGEPDPSDPIPIPDLPATNAGTMVNIWRIDADQLNRLHDFLWDDTNISWPRFVGQNPKEAIIGMNYLPVTVAGVTSEITVGNLSTGVQARKIGNYIHEQDCGSVYIPNKYGNFMDRNPYVKIRAYLPYIGMVDVDADLAVGKYLKLVYRIDVLSGACVAIIHNGTIIVGAWEGNCAAQVPWSTADKASIIGNTVAQGASAIMQATSGNIGGAVASTGNAIAGAMLTTLDKVAPQVHSGYTGNAGFMLSDTPYILTYRSVPNIPSSYGSEVGYMSNVTKKIGECIGMTVVNTCKLNIDCTENEKELIMNALHEGVIV